VPDAWLEKQAALARELARHESLAIAFSGGVDSGVLVHAAVRVLGARAVAVIADSPSLPRSELREARALADRIGARLVVVATDEADDPDYRANRGDRCYFCKAALFRALERLCRAEGIAAMAFGEITDDWRDVRPGARAAAEFGVVAPLSAAGFSKEDVRRYAREAGLPVAEKPASACLASRIPIGTPVDPRALARIERAEDELRALGFSVLRVRHHGELARVEVGRDEWERARARRALIEQCLSALGFGRVELARYVPPAERLL